MRKKLLITGGSGFLGKNLANELKKHDIYITASENEPSGNHHMEGALCGLPILYKDSGSTSEYCNNFGVSYEIESFLKSLDCDNITLIAHNAKFDSRFLIHHLKQCSEIENNGNYISFKGKFYNRKCKKNIKITIKDSYKLIPEPLKKFSKLFKLDVEKEYMDYKLYNKDNL